MSEHRKPKAVIQELTAYYKAPAPTGKRAFFRALPPRKISVPRMLFVQFGYLSKWVWPLSALVFLVMLAACTLRAERLAGLVLGMTPFLVLVSVTELARSLVCRMDELEAATVCSLPGILLARMCILGAENLLSLSVMALFLDGNVFRNLLYMLTPYLFTTAVSLGCVRKLRGRDAVSVCGVVAVFVCLIQIAVYGSGSWLYEARYLAVWLLFFAGSVYLAAREAVQMVRYTEIGLE